MVGGDHLHLMVPQEPCYPGVMSTLGPLIMKLSPADGELLPVADLAAGFLRHGHPAGPARPQRGSTWPSAVTATHTLIPAKPPAPDAASAWR